MPRIRFTCDPQLPLDWRHLPYVEGYEVDLSEDQAQRWIRRGVAEVIPDVAPEAEAAAMPPPAEDPPSEDPPSGDPPAASIDGKVPPATRRAPAKSK